MSLFLATLGLLLGGQGQAVLVEVEHEPGLESVVLEWGGGSLELRPAERQRPERDGIPERWVGLIGIDLDAAPGDVELPLRLRFADGRVASRKIGLRVESRAFPVSRLTVAPEFVNLSPSDQSRADEEAREISAVYGRVTPERLWSGPFLVPVRGADGGRNFGHRRVFNGEARAPHSGADLSAATGTPVLAANDGRVVLAKPLFFSGNAVFLDHGMGVYSVYLHLSEILVEAGSFVTKGTTLGLAGATGRVTGPHLHWGVRVLNARVDPFTLTGLEAD